MGPNRLLSNDVAVVAHEEHLVSPNVTASSSGMNTSGQIGLFEGVSSTTIWLSTTSMVSPGRSITHLIRSSWPLVRNTDRLQDRRIHCFGDRLLDLLFPWVTEDDDVSSLRLAPLIGQLVHHDPVVDLDGGEHRLRRDPEWLTRNVLITTAMASAVRTGRAIGEERTPWRLLGDRLLVDGARVVRDQYEAP